MRGASTLKLSVVSLFCKPCLSVGKTIIKCGLLIIIGMIEFPQNRGQVVELIPKSNKLLILSSKSKWKPKDMIYNTKSFDHGIPMYKTGILFPPK